MVHLLKEFWLQAIQVPRKIGLTRCLQVALHHFLLRMLLSALQYLHDLLQMALYLPLLSHLCVLHLHNPHSLPTHQCRWLLNLGRVNLNMDQLVCRHHQCSNLVACPHHPPKWRHPWSGLLHPLLGLLSHKFGAHLHHLSTLLVGHMSCHICQCPIHHSCKACLLPHHHSNGNAGGIFVTKVKFCTL